MENTLTLTPSRQRALQILASLPDPYVGITANAFAAKYYTGTPYEYLLTAVSNQGEGATAGKKAWLCAGSLLSKMAKDGLVRKHYLRGPGAMRYSITEAGRQLIGDKN